jgi:endonuclease/exonuclease/phosphatase family metal-dependent hydrolase
VRIITWNANRANRWNLLWADPLVQALHWDIICLQEVGNPSPNWTHASGPVWQQQSAQRGTDESFVQRKYTYQPAGYGAPLHIVHAEWPNRQKNHQAITTKTPTAWSTDLSGQMADRPAIGIKVRLNWPPALGRPATDILVGCVHIVANEAKSPVEVGQLLPAVNTMCGLEHAAGWILVGDFNCAPKKMMDEVPVPVGAWWPPFPTHDSTATLDYLLVEPALFKTFMATPGIGGNWVQGTAKSDHWLVEYTQINGPTVQII